MMWLIQRRVSLLTGGLLLLLAGQAASQAPQGTAEALYAQRFAAQCAACHGERGVSSLAQTPSLAGQHSFYAITQLFLFRQGRRDNLVMSAVARDMSDDDLRGFSEHIGRLPAQATAALAPTSTPAPSDAPSLDRGAALAKQLHCGSCHGADFAGGGQVPRLAGQRHDYLLHALQGFRSGQRLGYTPAMNEALAGVAAPDIDALALFLARLR